jgi:nitrous oxidase accessory protein
VEWRGHAISIWNSENNVIRHNDISYAKEGLFFTFANHNFVHDNRVSHSRYGIHYMSSNDNRFTDNVFTKNFAGALVMQSKGLFLKGNEFSDNRHSATAIGLLFKDVDDVWAEDNRITGNGTGIALGETPLTPTSTAIFHRNLVALNGTGVALTTTTGATFYDNSFVDNVRQVSGRGGSLMGSLAGHEPVAAAPAAPQQDAHAGHGTAAPAPATPAAPNRAAAKNRWTADGRGNYWSDYSGYDRDGDGLGDRPYRSLSAFDTLRDRQSALDLFRYTPAQQAIDSAARLFPVVKPDVLIEDSIPLMAPATALPREASGRALLLFSAALLAVAVLPVGLLYHHRPARRPLRLAPGGSAS